MPKPPELKALSCMCSCRVRVDSASARCCMARQMSAGSSMAPIPGETIQVLFLLANAVESALSSALRVTAKSNCVKNARKVSVVIWLLNRIEAIRAAAHIARAAKHWRKCKVPLQALARRAPLQLFAAIPPAQIRKRVNGLRRLDGAGRGRQAARNAIESKPPHARVTHCAAHGRLKRCSSFNRVVRVCFARRLICTFGANAETAQRTQAQSEVLPW